MTKEKESLKLEASFGCLGLNELVCEDGYVYFLIKVKDDVEYKMDFEVYEVIAWECDGKNTPLDIELYMTGTIKWDGCSSVWFGEKDEDEKQNGRLHLCGKKYWDRHSDVMKAVYTLAEKTIKNYDRDVAV